MKFQNVIKNNVFIRCFSAFSGQKSLKKNLEATYFEHNSTRTFDWCINCHILLRKKFWLFFLVRVPPFGKNRPKFFLNKIWQFIHQSKALVEFSRNMLLPNFLKSKFPSLPNLKLIFPKMGIFWKSLLFIKNGPNLSILDQI